jgi:hypothetical protein
MNYNLQHRDLAGAPLQPGDHCLVTEHNRIIPQNPHKRRFVESATTYIA